MTFEDKLKKRQYAQMWEEYCGFLDLDMAGYMDIQVRLMAEQIELWSASPLGEKILGGKGVVRKGSPREVINAFRRAVSLTNYQDYADILLQRKADMLPDTPVIWIETTWEGGTHPVKVAPYTRGMLDTYKNNVLACFLMATTEVKGRFDVKTTDKILYALAPLPYATGLFPLALNEEIGLQFLPSVKDAESLSFSERNKLGFKMGIRRGIEFFFGVGSVAYYVSTTLASMGKRTPGKPKSERIGISQCSMTMLFRLLRAKYRCRKEGRDLMPRDLFRLKGFMCAGTDCRCYKDELEELWGVRPLELFAGTEPTCIAAENWTRNGMYFFPDACFYEFIPEPEMQRNIDDPAYTPKTCLIDEVEPGTNYELVISVLKGGAFMRYRVGDMFRCVGRNNEDGTVIPRFEYIDRVPTVIDIANFTRISEQTIRHVVSMSGLSIDHWTALKEYSDNNRPFLHLYVEMAPSALTSRAVTTEILREHLSIYFKHMDSDYKNLKRLLGIEPLEITILACGTFDAYQERTGKTLRRINPPAYEVRELEAGR